MSLLGLLPALEKLAPAGGSAAVRAESRRCVRHWNHASGCQLCTDGCPTQAITLAEDGVILDEAACVRCGFCLHACPTGVFEGVCETGPLLKSVASLAARAAVDLTCGLDPVQHATPEADTLVQTGVCLAALGPAVYVGLAALGVERVGVRLERCAACPLRALRERIKTSCAAAAAFTTMRIDVVESAPAEPAPRPVAQTRRPQVSRRALFKRIVRAEPPSDLLPPAPPPQTRTPPPERRLLLHFLERLPAERRAAGTSFPMLAADAACTACRVCATVCPTGALTFGVEGSSFALELDPRACTGCGLCVELCAPGALQPADRVGFADAQPVTLLAGAVRKCARCRALFAGSGTLCPACAFRRSNPSGSSPRPILPSRP